MNVGITSLGICLPDLALPAVELAKLRKVDPDKYTIGLGVENISLCNSSSGVIQMATKAAERAISRWKGDIKDIGLIAVGTESPVDFSRPLSAWVAENLGIKGYVRSYEVKHACYGGTLALKQAQEWLLASGVTNKCALVIAVDEAIYEENDPGEPTQGAGAVAFIVGKPEIASIQKESIFYSEPVFDFYKPLDRHYPVVDGAFSLECYKKATIACFSELIKDNDAAEFLSNYSAMCFHVPFPKMVYKAFMAVGKHFHFCESEVMSLFKYKVSPFLEWNKQSGNAYTASLWLAVANALSKISVNEKMTSFSYGSGFGSELLCLHKTSSTPSGWVKDIEEDLKNRTVINASTYADLRQKKKKI